MNELIENLSLGFSVAFTVQNLLYALLGCVLGTLIGVLPGLGPIATISMLLPATYALPPVAALIMLAGIYYGAQYGGSTTAILKSPRRCTEWSTRCPRWPTCASTASGTSPRGSWPNKP